VAGRNPVENPHTLKKSGIIYLQADKFTIKNTDGAPLHIDGEPRETEKQFSIRVIQNCFKLIQPAFS
jgi:diacylglycerol kinase family enzyme